jgi:3-oxoadipyl-CoA thiolase
MREVFVCGYARTPIGRYGGALSKVRPDDLAAVPLKALLRRQAKLDPAAIDDVVLGCANQAGEDNRNVARMAVLLAGLPLTVPGTTINRLCGSGMDALFYASRAIRAGEAEIIVAGGVESMSRAPFVMPKSEAAFARANYIYDTTIGWRFVNPAMERMYGTDSMPQTADNVAAEFSVSRADQDVFAFASQTKAANAIARGRLAREIVTVEAPGRRGETLRVDRDEHPRADTTLEALSALPAIGGRGGTVTAGNSSGVNDGAAAVILASADAVRQHRLEPVARILGGAAAGVEPRIMGIGPVAASLKVLRNLGLGLDEFAVFEFNEAFAAQVLASIRTLRLRDDDPRINPNGGAIALGHPLGMSGARIVGSAALELGDLGRGRALCAMCVGVGQGIALALEAV